MLTKLIYLFYLKYRISKRNNFHPNTRKRILISIIRPSLNHYTELILALGLMHIGHNVNVIIGSSTMFYEDFQVRNDRKFFTGYIKYFLFSRCIYGIRLRGFVVLLRLLGIPFQKLKTYSLCKKEEWHTEENFMHNKHYLASIRRWKSGTNKKAPYFIKRKIKNNIDIANNFLSLNRSNFDLLISSHGIYSLWGPYYTAFEGAAIIIGEDVYHKNSMITAKGPIQITKKNMLQNGTKIETDFETWLNSRAKVRSEDQNTFRFDNKEAYVFGTKKMFKDINDLEVLLDSRLDGQNSILLLPNTTWDGDISERNIAFKNLQEWVKYTAELPEALVIVRAHPAEIGLKSYAPSLFSQLPLETIKNIIFLPGDFFLNSYALSEMCDKITVYDSIIGIELAGAGKDVIISAFNRHYLQEEWLVPKSQLEYRERIISTEKKNFYDVAQDSHHKLFAGSMSIPGWQGEARSPNLSEFSIDWLDELKELVSDEE